MCSIDRGGLIRITENMHHALMAIEAVTRSFYANSKAHQMDASYKDKITEEVINESDVQFHWSQAASNMHEEDSKEIILCELVTNWITIRGFSFTKSILERYKQETKKGTQKSKALRATLHVHLQTSIASYQLCICHILRILSFILNFRMHTDMARFS